MRCEIRHTTEYHYPRPAWNSFNQVRLHPAVETRQSVRLFHLNVTPRLRSPRTRITSGPSSITSTSTSTTATC